MSERDTTTSVYKYGIKKKLPLKPALNHLPRVSERYATLKYCRLLDHYYRKVTGTFSIDKEARVAVANIFWDSLGSKPINITNKLIAIEKSIHDAQYGMYQRVALILGEASKVMLPRLADWYSEGKEVSYD